MIFIKKNAFEVVAEIIEHNQAVLLAVKCRRYKKVNFIELLEKQRSLCVYFDLQQFLQL